MWSTNFPAFCGLGVQSSPGLWLVPGLDFQTLTSMVAEIETEELASSILEEPNRFDTKILLCLSMDHGKFLKKCNSSFKLIVFDNYISPNT